MWIYGAYEFMKNILLSSLIWEIMCENMDVVAKKKFLATNFSSFCWSQEEVLKQQKTTRDDRKLSPFCERRKLFSTLFIMQ